MTSVFRLFGLDCGRCGLPARLGELLPDGSVLTAHMDERKRSCRSLCPAASKQPDRRGAEPPVDLPGRAPAPVRSSSLTDRRSA